MCGRCWPSSRACCWRRTSSPAAWNGSCRTRCAGPWVFRPSCSRSSDFVPASVPHTYVTVPISFLAAVQIGLFRNVGDLAYLPVATTGNLMRFMESAYDGFVEKRRGASGVRGLRHTDPRVRRRGADRRDCQPTPGACTRSGCPQDSSQSRCACSSSTSASGCGRGFPIRLNRFDPLIVSREDEKLGDTMKKICMFLAAMTLIAAIVTACGGSSSTRNHRHRSRDRNAAAKARTADGNAGATITIENMAFGEPLTVAPGAADHYRQQRFGRTFRHLGHRWRV